MSGHCFFILFISVTYFFHVHHSKNTQEEADRDLAIFLEGYRERRQISEEELAAIPYLGVMFWVFALGFYEENYDDFAINFLTPRFLKDRTALIKKWVDTNCRF